MMIGRSHLALLFLLGCSRHDAAPVVDASVPVAPTASPPEPPSVVPDASVDARAPTLATTTEPAKDEKPPREAEIDQPLVKLGDLSVWSSESTIFAAHDGKSTRVVRRTSGTVAALAVTKVDDELAIAWASSLGDGKGQVVALVFAASDLGHVSAPVTLGIVSAPVAEQGHVAIARNPRGGVVVAHEGATGRCSLDGTPVDCVTYEVKAVTRDGKVTKLGGGKLHGGPSPAFSLKDLDREKLRVEASSMRGGRTVDTIVVPYAP